MCVWRTCAWGRAARTQVRQQTLDVVSVLRQAEAFKMRYYMFMEDDFRLCPHALTAISYAVRKVWMDAASFIMYCVCLCV